MRVSTVITSAAAGLVLAAAAPAVASPGAGPVTAFTAAFTTHATGADSGLVLRTAGAPPAAPTIEPPAVRQTVTLPRGTRVRLGALPQCAASDADVAANGAEAVCPATSRVGTGRAEGVTSNGPVVFDLGVYALRGHLWFAGERDGMSLKAGFGGVGDGRRLTLTVPTANGTISPTVFRARIDAGGWLRTPRTCPAGHAWTFRGAFRGLDATGIPVGDAQRAVSTQRCRAA